MVSTIRRSRAREEHEIKISQDTGSTAHGSCTDDTLSNSAGRVVSEECAAVGEHLTERKILEAISTINVTGDITSNLFNIDGVLILMLTAISGKEEILEW